MPIYEYKCSKCSHEFESIQKFSDEPLTECPECKGNVEKQISNSAFHLKGSGWYSDGYGKSSGGDSSKPSGDGEKKSGSGSTGGGAGSSGCGHSGGCSSC